MEVLGQFHKRDRRKLEQLAALQEHHVIRPQQYLKDNHYNLKSMCTLDKIPEEYKYDSR